MPLEEVIIPSYQYPSSKKEFIQQLLAWADSNFSHFAYFNSNNIAYPHDGFRHIIGIGSQQVLSSNTQTRENLAWIDRSKQWWMGAFSYDLKNEFEKLKSENPASIKAEHSTFFIPEIIIELQSEHYVVLKGSERFKQDEVMLAKPALPSERQGFTNKAHTSKDKYLQDVHHIRHRIKEGDFYEINYCLEFSENNFEINPVDTYLRLNHQSPMPFSGLTKLEDKYLICASPERFLKKTGRKVVSQPIKGTIKRSADENEDQHLKIELQNSEKERAENMMIVDLVRNDLAKVAAIGTVHVEEMFGIYSFKHLHQMISTVSAILKSTCNLPEIIEASFPMGSMTGAPKIRVMQEIEDLEPTRRGYYSGSMGYITPEQDFDFNVIIRSLIYDKKQKSVSYHVGSAITYDSQAEKEYEECLLKAKALLEILKGRP